MAKEVENIEVCVSPKPMKLWPPSNRSWVKFIPGDTQLPGLLEPQPEKTVLNDLLHAEERLCSGTVDVTELAAKFGYTLDGKSIPKEARLKSLYGEPNRTELMNENVVYTICLGLQRTERDPKNGGIEGHWQHADLPELWETTPAVVETDDVTAYAKYHIHMKDGKSVSLTISPMQMTHFKLDAVGEVREELRRTEGSSSVLHNVNRRIRLLERNPNTSIFEYDDRLIVLALAGLEMAKALNIKDVRVRTFRGRQTRYAQRAEEILGFLQTNNRFNFREQ